MPEKMHAYDYHPAFSTVLMDHWRRFDPSAMRAELMDIKQKHPDANAVRLTHSYDAYLRNTKLYISIFEQMLGICVGLDLKVVCCLFNRWHDVQMDCGGIYLEYLIPGLSWAYKENFFMPFLWDICQTYAKDPRICLWESCNKPFGAYRDFSNEIIENHLYEKRWLREMYCYIKQTGTSIPVAISGQDWFREVELKDMADCCDVMLRSPYYANVERSLAIRKVAWDTAPMPVMDIMDANDGKGRLTV